MSINIYIALNSHVIPLSLSKSECILIEDSFIFSHIHYFLHDITKYDQLEFVIKVNKQLLYLEFDATMTTYHPD